MSVIIPRDIRTNPTSTAVWLASRRRNRLRGGGFNPPVIPGLTVGKTTESGLTFYGFGLGVGSLVPAEFLTTGQNITRLGAIDIGDFADNGDFANNGDFALATFDKLVLGDGLPDVGSVEVTINGITTTATFNNGSYESTDANAEAIYNLLKSNVGTTYSFDIVEAVPSGNLTLGDTTPLTGFASKGYAGASLPVQVGSLSPDVLLNGIRLDGIYTPLTGDIGNNETAIFAQLGQPNDFGDSSINYNLTFDGTAYLFTFDGSNYSTNSAPLKQFIEDKAASGEAVVFTAEAIAPSGNLTVSDSILLTGEPDSTGYASVSFTGGSGIGSLSPPVSVGGVLLDAIYSNNTDIGDGTKKYIFMGDVGGLIEGRVNATFNGVTYEFDSLFGAGSPPGIQSDSLYDFLLANRDTPIVFIAEAIAPPSSQITIATGTYSNGQSVAGYGVGVLQGGGDLGIISPPLLLDGQIITELSIRNNNGISYPNTVTAAGATDIGDLYLNIGTDTFTLVWIGFRYAIPGGSGGQQQQQFYDFLVANDGAVLPISITDTPLFTVVI